ncbi:MAG: hypothetical protein NTW87_20940 [Planctomycetota bacterium]|nr:hypothetical protein [Planctomycetota bacterium]
MRRCEDCHRLSRGHSGDPCPHCGGTNLTHVVFRPPPGQHHPAILTLAVTFCGGLVVLWMVATWISPPWLPATPAYGNLLWHLQLLIVAATVLYLVLRRAEGDFRALFIVALGLFLVTESLGALARGYGFTTLHDLGKPFNLTLFIYSSLAVTAAIADGRRREAYHGALVAAATGFLCLATLRAAFEMKGREMDGRVNNVMTVALGGIVICVAFSLLKHEITARRHKDRVLAPGPATLSADSGTSAAPPAKTDETAK